VRSAGGNLSTLRVRRQDVMGITLVTAGDAAQVSRPQSLANMNCCCVMSEEGRLVLALLHGRQREAA
jgi:hypothetical protein